MFCAIGYCVHYWCIWVLGFRVSECPLIWLMGSFISQSSNVGPKIQVGDPILKFPSFYSPSSIHLPLTLPSVSMRTRTYLILLAKLWSKREIKNSKIYLMQFWRFLIVKLFIKKSRKFSRFLYMVQVGSQILK